MTASNLKHLAQTHLARLLDKRGCVLYSAAETLRPGDLYILGLNPRGSRSDKAKTLAEDLQRLPTRTCNAYESQWKDYDAGEAPIQRRLKWVVEQLGYELKNVCASNLIFTSSNDAEGCGYPERADICWPVHERILEIVRPRCILTFGNSGKSPYRYLRKRYLTDGQEEGCFKAGHGPWKCRCFCAHVPATGRDTLVIGLPHLARYDPTRPEAAEAMRRIRELVGTTAIAN